MGWDGSGFCSYSMRDVHQQDGTRLGDLLTPGNDGEMTETFWKPKGLVGGG